MQIRCPHCQNPIEVVQDDESVNCPSCDKTVSPTDAQTLVQIEDSGPVDNAATLEWGGDMPPLEIPDRIGRYRVKRWLHRCAE